ncbi:MAG: hypothetical protein LBD46_08460 [Endomicrobium sp.]|jgi:hypothetical protein|nr:hypothetical protein [Endomicrobium sp.]
MINTQHARRDYLADGINRVFGFDFDIWKGAGVEQIKLFIKDTDGIVVEVTAGFNISLQNRTITYPVSQATAPVKEGSTVIVARWLPIIQDSDFTTNGAYTPKMVEDALDYEIMVIQQVEDNISNLINGFDTSDDTLAEAAKYTNSKVEIEKNERIEADETLNTKIETEKENRIADVSYLQELYKKFKDGYIVIGSYDFGTPTPTQEELTAKANEFKGGASINTGDTIENLNDKRRWYWNTELAKWIDFGAVTDISTQYADGMELRTIRKEGFFYINNASSSDSAYPLPPGVYASNRCFGFCHKGKEQYYGYDIYYINAMFFNVGSSVGAMAMINTSGYWIVVCDDILYLNTGWQEVAPQIYKDYYRKNLFTKISGSRTGLVPNPTYSGVSTDNRPEIKFNFSDTGAELLGKMGSGYLKRTSFSDYTRVIDINFSGDMYLMLPNAAYVYNLPYNVYTSYKVLNDIFADVSSSEFEQFELVYSTVEDRFRITSWLASGWIDVWVGYLGKFNINMDDSSGTNYTVEVLRQGKAGLSLWPVDLEAV